MGRQTTKVKSGRGTVGSTPAVPTGLTALPISTTEIYLNWDTPYSSSAKTVAITGWKVYRSTTSGSGFTLRSTVTVSEYTDTGTPGTTYYYKVAAVGPYADSSQTAQVSATTQADYQPPAWTIPDLPGVDKTYSAVKGGTVSLLSDYAANDGTPYFSIQSITAAGASDTSGISINPSTGEVSIAETTPSDSYDVAVSLASNSAESDWITRSTGPGVVWAHNFDSAAEVTQFGATTTMAWEADGFAGGGCVTMNCPTGSYAATGWWRPFSPLRAGDNGKATDDPGAGTITPQAWRGYALDNYGWRKGYYAHPSVQASYPYWPTPGTTGIYDGTEFYIQFRVKLSATRWTQGNPPGKLAFIDCMGITTSQEIVLISDGDWSDYWYQTNPFRMYTNRGQGQISALSNPQGDGGGASMQPGSAWANTCTIGGATTLPNKCWEWPSDEWVTILMYVKPGTYNLGLNSYTPVADVPVRDFVIKAWAARAGESAYTPLFDKSDLAWYYWSQPQGANNGPTGEWHPPAFNSFCPSNYMNNVATVQGWTQKFTQVIFSKSVIPCPQA